jgi:hypothetical protein
MVKKNPMKMKAELQQEVMEKMKKGGMKQVHARKLGGDILSRLGSFVGDSLQTLLGFKKGGKVKKMKC